MKFRLRRCPIGAHAIFDGHTTFFIFAERSVNDPIFLADVAVDNGQVLLLHFAFFPELAQLARGFSGLGGDGDAAGFAVEAIHELRMRLAAEMQAHPADEAGQLAVLARMANQTGGFVDDQQFSVFVDDFKKFFHAVIV